MFKKILFAFFFLGSIQFTFAQSLGKVTGKVVNSTNQPIVKANINIKGTTKGTESDRNGKFSIRNINPGKYVLQVTYVGYQEMEVPFSIKAHTTKKIPSITLIGKEETLGAVIINRKRRNNFTRKKTVYVAKMPLKRIENPQVYNSITAEVLQSQVITNFGDALKNASGVTKLWESTGRGGDGAGYYSLRGFAVQPNLINGLPGVSNGSPDPANIESVQVIKGPSGTLYGSSLISYGGLINIVTKKPYNYFGGNVSYTTGSYGLNRVTADVNAPLKKGVNLRVNSAYHDQNSFQDAGFRKSFFIAPSLSYKVNKKLSFLINTEFYSGESTNATALFLDRAHPLRVHNMDELKYDNKKSYTSDDVTLENNTYSLQGQMNYKISDAWTSQTVLSRSSSKTKGIYAYLYENTSNFDTKDNDNELPVNGVLLDEGVVFKRSLNHQNSTTLSTDIQQNFIGDFKIGDFRNRLVAGLDYYNQRLKNSSSGYISDGLVYIGNASQQNVNESVYGIENSDNYLSNYDNGILSEAGIDDLLAGSAVNPSVTKQETYSAYVSDVFNILPELSAMASLRIDHFKNTGNSQTSLSPKFGVVYQPILNKISVFANYMDGFSNVDPVINQDQETLEFDPEHANQFEVGSKLNFFNDKLTATLSYYDIEVSNTVINPEPNVYTQGGEKYSRGFEASFVANPIDGLNIIAGYSHNESKLTKASASDDFVGRRPESAGPKNLANLWTTYHFTYGNLKGFGLGFGGNYGSENKIFNRNKAGTFTLDSYTVLNASLFYNTKKFGITLKLNNLNDEEYYTGWSTISPQIGRNLSANFTYRF